jgi:hypothetical protein
MGTWETQIPAPIVLIFLEDDIKMDINGKIISGKWSLDDDQHTIHFKSSGDDKTLLITYLDNERMEVKYNFRDLSISIGREVFADTDVVSFTKRMHE